MSTKVVVRPAHCWLAGIRGWWWQVHEWGDVFDDGTRKGWVVAIRGDVVSEGFAPTQGMARRAAKREARRLGDA